MNKQWSVVTTLKRGWLTYVSTKFSINCLLNAISSCRLFKQWVQWKVGLRRLRRGGGRMTAAGRPRPVAADSSEEKPIKSWIASTTYSCTSMPLVLLYIAPWSQWSFCSTGDVCIAKQGSYRSTCSPKLYIPSTLNIDLILWHTQLIVCAENSNQGLNHGVFLSPFKLTPCPIHWIAYVLAYSKIFEF